MNSGEITTFPDLLRECLRIIEPLRELLPAWHQKIHTILTEGAGDRLRIGVVGVTSSGKSTFINALLGEQILPEQSKATTNLPVICRYGPVKKLRVVFPNDAVTPHVADAVTPALLKSLCSEDGNPGNEQDIWRLELEMPTSCLPPTLEIIDTPGTDAYGLANHETLTLYRCLPLSDIIVFMTSARKAGLTVAEERLLGNIVDNDQRVLFVISQIDVVEADYQDGRLFRSREAKVRNRVAALERSLALSADLKPLKTSGVVAVSSSWAKIAAGDHTLSKWRESNFESVLKWFDSYAADLTVLLLRSRIDRTRANITTLISAIQLLAPSLSGKAAQVPAEDDFAAKLTRFLATEKKLQRRLSDFRKVAMASVDPETATAEAVADLATVYGSDSLGVQTAMVRIESRWQETSRALLATLDEVRSACRRELEALQLSPARDTLRKRQLHLSPFPNWTSRIVTRTETYEVQVPRTSFWGKIADFFTGVRTERRSTTSETIDKTALRRDLQAYLGASAEQMIAFVDEQIEMFRTLYLGPIQEARKIDEEFLENLRSLRQKAAAQAEELPAIVSSLRQLLRHSLFAQSPQLDLDTNPSIPPSTPDLQRVPSSCSGASDLSRATAALYGILERAWESVAIRCFWEVARGTAVASDHLDRVLWVGGEIERFDELICYLTRSMRDFGDPAARRPLVRAVKLEGPSGTTELSCSLVQPDRLECFDELCAEASVIAIDFDAAQPSSGLNRMLNDPRFGILRPHTRKLFFVSLDGGVFDAKLHDLVTEVVEPVAKATGLASNPWFVCEPARYDARYSALIRLSGHVRRSGGGARDLIRLWREDRLSLRPPFQVTNLEQAFAFIQSQGAIASDE